MEPDEQVSGPDLILFYFAGIQSVCPFSQFRSDITEWIPECRVNRLGEAGIAFFFSNRGLNPISITKITEIQ